MLMRLPLFFAITALVFGISSPPMEAQAPLMPPSVIGISAETPGMLVSKVPETEARGTALLAGSALMAGVTPGAEPIPQAPFYPTQSSWQRGALIGAGVGAAAGLVGAMILNQTIREAVGRENRGTPVVIGATVAGAAVGALVGAGIGWLASER